MSEPPKPKFVRTPELEIAYEERGPADGIPIVCMHGFPDDPRTWDEVVEPLAAKGYRTIVPWLRGYGPTRFLSAETLRSGEQAALGYDLKNLIEALHLDKPYLVGYDWGGRACCIVAALWPEKISGLVTIGGYNMQMIAKAAIPAYAEREHRLWYNWYFMTERGRAGLQQNRRDICKLLWKLWSPGWTFDDATFERTAVSFDNPDFVDVVIQSYRHRQATASGDPALLGIEAQIAKAPLITVPTIMLNAGNDGIGRAKDHDAHLKFFTHLLDRRLVEKSGHFMSREVPEPVVEAVLEITKTRG